MADACLRAGVLDRIIVQNNPVNFVDPYGLSWLDGFIYGATGGLLGSAAFGDSASDMAANGVIGGLIGLTGLGAWTAGGLGAAAGIILVPSEPDSSGFISLERQRENEEIARLLWEAKQLNEELDFICQHTGGCNYDPCN
jgi:hypothetical protein